MAHLARNGRATKEDIDQCLEGAALRLNHARLHLARARCLSDLCAALDELGTARRTIVEMMADIDGLRIDYRLED